MNSDFIQWKEVILLSLALGCADILAFYPLLFRFLPYFRKNQSYQALPVSDVPGVREHYDYALISGLCTLPDPKNYLGVFGRLPLKGGVRFHVPRFTLCRYHSISLYAGLRDPKQDYVPSSLADHEIVYNADGSFDVVISEDKPPACCQNWLPAQGISDGLLIFRKYGVPNGVLIHYPAFYRLSDGSLIKPAYSTVSGPQSAELSPNHRYHRLLKLLRLKIGTAVMLSLSGRWSLWEINLVCLLAACILFAFNSLLWHAGQKKARHMILSRTKGVLHEAVEPVIDFGVGSGLPHPHHKYYVINYDARKADIRITGKIMKKQIKYFSLCAYDQYGISLPQSFSDDTIIPLSMTRSEEEQSKRYTSSSSHLPFSLMERRLNNHPHKEGHDEEIIDYEVILSTGKLKAIRDYEEPNVLDVSAAPVGACLIRIIYPENEQVFLKSKPNVEVLEYHDGSHNGGQDQDQQSKKNS